MATRIKPTFEMDIRIPGDIVRKLVQDYISNRLEKPTILTDFSYESGDQQEPEDYYLASVEIDIGAKDD